MAALREELCTYGGYSPTQIDQMLSDHAAPAAASRRTAAAEQLARTRAFSSRRAAEWRTAAGALGGWLVRAGALFEEHKGRAARGEAGVRAALRCACGLAEWWGWSVRNGAARCGRGCRGPLMALQQHFGSLLTWLANRHAGRPMTSSTIKMRSWRPPSLPPSAPSRAPQARRPWTAPPPQRCR